MALLYASTASRFLTKHTLSEPHQSPPVVVAGYSLSLFVKLISILDILLGFNGCSCDDSLDPVFAPECLLLLCASEREVDLRDVQKAFVEHRFLKATCISCERHDRESRSPLRVHLASGQLSR